MHVSVTVTLSVTFTSLPQHVSRITLSSPAGALPFSSLDPARGVAILPACRHWPTRRISPRIVCVMPSILLFILAFMPSISFFIPFFISSFICCMASVTPANMAHTWAMSGTLN